MIRQQLEVKKPRQPFEEIGDGDDVLDSGVDTRNDGRADLDGDVFLGQCLDIPEHHGVTSAGISTMEFVVHRLDIVEDEVGMWEDSLECGPRRIAACVEASVEAGLFGGLQDGGSELWLVERLTAGERNAATGIFIEWAVFLDLGDDFGYSDSAAVHDHGLRRADLGANATIGAGSAVYDDRIFTARQGLLGTRLDTTATSDAVGDIIGHDRCVTLCLRIVAPLTTQWAALEEDCRPNAGAVVNCEFLNICDKTRGTGQMRKLCFRSCL